MVFFVHSQSYSENFYRNTMIFLFTNQLTIKTFNFFIIGTFSNKITIDKIDLSKLACSRPGEVLVHFISTIFFTKPQFLSDLFVFSAFLSFITGIVKSEFLIFFCAKQIYTSHRKKDYYLYLTFMKKSKKHCLA